MTNIHTPEAGSVEPRASEPKAKRRYRRRKLKVEMVTAEDFDPSRLQAALRMFISEEDIIELLSTVRHKYLGN